MIYYYGFPSSDVQFHLITYGGENRWPSHVTVGGKLQFKGKAPPLKFSAAPKGSPYTQGPYSPPFQHYIAIIEDVLYDLKLAIGQDLTAQTFTEAFYYPFRPSALKSIVVVNSKPCEVGRFFLVSKNNTKLKLCKQLTDGIKSVRFKQDCTKLRV